MKHPAYILLFLLACSSSTRAQTCMWARSAGGSGNDTGIATATDSAGDVFVTGTFASATISFGNTTLVNASPGRKDVFVARYDGSGNVIWAKSLGGPGNDAAYSIACDRWGNVVLCGSFDSSLTAGTTSIINSSPQGGSDIFVSKLSSSGTFIWTKGYVGNGTDIAEGIRTDKNGNILMCGMFGSSILTIGTTTLNNTYAYSVFICKMDSGGTDLWANASNNCSAQAFSIAVDTAGNASICGWYTGNKIVFGIDSAGQNSAYMQDFVYRFDPSGNVSWGRAFGTLSKLYGIATDPQGNVIATGMFQGSTLSIGPYTLVNNHSNFNDEAFIMKYTSNGILDWARQASGPVYENATDVATDQQGNIYFTGNFDTAPVSFNQYTLNSPASALYLVKLDTGGNALGGTGIDLSGWEPFDMHRISITNSGDVYLTSSVLYQTILGPDTLAPVGNSDMMIMKYACQNVGIPEQTIEFSFDLFPNPAENEIHITFNYPEEVGTADILLYSMDGKLVLHKQLSNNTTVEIAGLAKGIYMARVTSSGHTSCRKVILR